ncbi:MAG: CPBP family intramembrane metalloprotease [Candidatus Levybacteria bacterium]|nr:CPBP family intramembrane metalloprotease [Candidatus Levybacteria bacterium]
MKKQYTQSKKPSSISLQNIFGAYVAIFLLWFIYRYTTHFGDLVDELLVKPIIWLLPVFFLMLPKKNLFALLTLQNLTIKKIFLAVMGGLFLSLLQILPNMLKGYDHFHISANFSVLAIATIGTALSEELLFRGFIFTQLQKYYSSITSYTITSFLFAAIHIPILLFVNHIYGTSLLIPLYVVFASSIMFCFLYTYTKNLWAPIIAHYVLDMLLIIF